MLTCAISIGLLLGANAQNKSIDFKQEGTFSDRLAEAGKSKKLIFLDAYTSWCGPCKVLAKEVFTVDSIADFFNANFINVHYDMEKGEGLELMKRYKSDITGYPTLLFINDKGEIVHKIVGAPTAKEFLEMARPALSPELSLKGLAQRFEAGDRSISTVTAYLKTLGNSNDRAKSKAAATSYFDALSTDELKKPEVWALMTKYLFNTESKSFKYILGHRVEFNKSIGEEKVNSYLLRTLSGEVGDLSSAYYGKKAVDTKKEDWLMSTLKTIHNDKAAEGLLKVQLISSRNKGDWDTFNKVMVQMINSAKPISVPGLKASMMLNFTRKFINAAPEAHLKDALSWIDLLLKMNIAPPTVIDLLAFKKAILTKQGNAEGIQSVDKELVFQQRLKTEAEQRGETFNVYIKGFM